jgi:hypothetical protein
VQPEGVVVLGEYDDPEPSSGLVVGNVGLAQEIGEPTAPMLHRARVSPVMGGGARVSSRPNSMPHRGSSSLRPWATSSLMPYDPSSN